MKSVAKFPAPFPFCVFRVVRGLIPSIFVTFVIFCDSFTEANEANKHERNASNPSLQKNPSSLKSVPFVVKLPLPSLFRVVAWKRDSYFAGT